MISFSFMESQWKQAHKPLLLAVLLVKDNYNQRNKSNCKLQSATISNSKMRIECFVLFLFFCFLQCCHPAFKVKGMFFYHHHVGLCALGHLGNGRPPLTMRSCLRNLGPLYRASELMFGCGMGNLISHLLITVTIIHPKYASHITHTHTHSVRASKLLRMETLKRREHSETRALQRESLN